MRILKIINLSVLLLFISSCSNNNNLNANNPYGAILNNPDVISGIVSGQSAGQIATTALLKNIGIGNITGGSSGGAGSMVSSFLSGNKSGGDSLASAALSNGLVKNVLSKSLGGSGFLNNKNPQYLLNADISDIAKSFTGNGGNSGSILYNLVNKSSGSNVLSQAITSKVTGGNPGNALLDNASQLMGLLNAF